MRKITGRDALALSLALGFLLAAVLCCRFSAFACTADRVRQDTLRLHIRANSDSGVDQRLKLLVRDAILCQAGELLGGSATKAQAMERAARSLPRIQEIARKTLMQAGHPQPVRVSLVRMDFATTAYSGFTLPAGPYDAVRIEIGSGKGHNWFCVLYPGLCLPAAKGESLYPDPAQQQLVDSRPTVKFAVLEWWQRLFDRKITHKS